MNPKKLKTASISVVLCCTMVLSGCWFKASWIQTALSDLPVLIQMAGSIMSLVALTKTGNAPSQQELAAIQQISTVAMNGLQAIQALYNSYTNSNATTTVQEIQAACQALVSNLQQLLTAAQIKDPALLNRISAAVGLIDSTVNTFLALLPKAATSRVEAKAINAKLPKPKDLRTAWLQQVGTPLLK